MMRLVGRLGMAVVIVATLGAASQPHSETNSPGAPALAGPEGAQDAATPDIVKGETVPTTVPAGYELVWSDEFSQPGLPDRTKWKYDIFRNQEGWFNNEKQYYSADRMENARIKNGSLIIEAREEALDAAQYPDWDWVTGLTAFSRFGRSCLAGLAHGLQYGCCHRPILNGPKVVRSTLWSMWVLNRVWFIIRCTHRPIILGAEHKKPPSEQSMMHATPCTNISCYGCRTFCYLVSMISPTFCIRKTVTRHQNGPLTSLSTCCSTLRLVDPGAAKRA